MSGPRFLRENRVHLSDERRRPGGTALGRGTWRPAGLFDRAREKAALGLGPGELERALEGRACLVCTTETAQEICACRVEVLVAVEVEPVDDRERRLGSVGFGDGDGTVHLDDGRAGQPGELRGQDRDLPPL